MNRTDNKDARYVVIPETYTRRNLNTLYREIPLKDTVSRTMRKYFNAMANLYGVIPLKKAYEIISEQSPSLVSEDEFLAFAEIAKHECEDYYILGEEDIYTDGRAGTPYEREIVDVTLFGADIDLYIQTKQSQQGKPYFVPEKKQLLLYDDAFYCEATPEVTELRTFLSEQFKLGETQEAAVFQEILYGSRYLNAEFAQVMKRLYDMGLEFEDDDTVQRFISLHQAFHNTTRMQCNRGFTPDELFSMQPPENRMPKSISLGPNIRTAIANGTMDVADLRKSILNAELPNEELRFSLLRELSEIEKDYALKKKVGRNELCPCGSGKKYKKCCGR